MHRLGKTPAHMKELQTKREARAAPERMIGAKAQRLVLIVAELRHCRRQHLFGRLKCVGGEETRLAFESRVIKRLRRPAPGNARGRGIGNRVGESGRGQHNRGLQYFASTNHWLSDPKSKKKAGWHRAAAPADRAVSHRRRLPRVRPASASV